MSVPTSNNRARTVNNSGTRMGVHTDVNTDITANTRVNNGGNKALHKEQHVHGGDARLRLQGSRLTAGSQHTSINMPSAQPTAHQSTIIIPQLNNPPATVRPWADSAFGTYYVPSVRMSITVSIASTLSILLVFFLCRTYMGSKTNKLGRKFTKKASAAMERIVGKGQDNDMHPGNMEMGAKPWPNPGVSTTDLAQGVKTVNMLMAKTAQLEQTLARQEQLLQGLAKTDDKVPPVHVAEHLHDSAGESDEHDFAQRRPAQTHRRPRQGRPAASLPGPTLSKGDLRTLFLSWTSHFFETSKRSSPREEGEEQTPRRQRSASGESSRSGRKRTAQPSPERDGTKDGVKGGSPPPGYPVADLEEAWASFEDQFLNRRGKKKICYSYTKDELGY